MLRMVREWRHLKMLLRAGRGNDPAGVKSTKRGELAVLCPACPQPGLNLPDGWEDAPPEKRYVLLLSHRKDFDSRLALHRYLFRLILGMDANFRLKRKRVSSEKSDPSLGEGWAYLVNEVEYKEFLTEYGTLIVQEVSFKNILKCFVVFNEDQTAEHLLQP